MALIVQKYGGTSVGDVDRIRGVAQRIKGYIDQGHQVVVVVSAMSGETNRLVTMGHDIGGDQGSAREMDVLTASGEQVTISLTEPGTFVHWGSGQIILGRSNFNKNRQRARQGQNSRD